MKKHATNINNTMNTLLIVQLIGALFLKGAVDDMWGLFLTLQIISFLSIYNTPTPANVEIYVRAFRDTVKFEVLKPDKLIGIFKPGFKLSNYLTEKNQIIEGNVANIGESKSLISNMIIYITALVVFLIFVGIITCFIKVKRF
jgi:hypothetical protein